MKQRRWWPWPQQCDDCGGDAEVYATSEFGAYDDDAVRCTGCKATGHMTADENSCYVTWHELADDEQNGDRGE